MSVTFNKPYNLKYTDMCIYVDKNMPLTVDVGKYPEIESKIFEYLYHVVYALAHKAVFFKNFDDYDGFALYSAGELYMNMRKKLQAAGTQIRGKTVVPVKSCLNYIKAVLFPFKVNYQNQTFTSIYNPEIGQDTSVIESYIKDSVRIKYTGDLDDCYKKTLKDMPIFLKEILNNTPYKKDPLMIKKLRISCTLTLINDITLSTKVQNKINKKLARLDASYTSAYVEAYRNNASDVILWHLDKGLGDYVKILVKKLKNKFSEELEEELHQNDLSENLIDCVINSARESFLNNNNGGGED